MTFGFGPTSVGWPGVDSQARPRAKRGVCVAFAVKTPIYEGMRPMPRGLGVMQRQILAAVEQCVTEQVAT
jgi:hypothetical protein